MTKYIFDTDEIERRFSYQQIKHYMNENKFTKLQAIFYLWAFNNFSTNTDEVKTDLGRPMYRKLAKRLDDLFKLCGSRIGEKCCKNVSKPNSQHYVKKRGQI